MNPSSREAAAQERRARWWAIVEQAARSALPVRLFCQERRVDEVRFYYWRRMLAQEAGTPEASVRKSGAKEAAAPGVRFALVSPKIVPAAERDSTGFDLAGGAPELPSVALELVLDRCWRLRIPRGVDETPLRCVLAALAAHA